MGEIEYNYRTIDEISKHIMLYSQFGVMELSILIGLCALFSFIILYALPNFRQYKLLKHTQLDKTKKKLALKQIVIQKEIEEEIEKELKSEAEQRLGK